MSSKAGLISLTVFGALVSVMAGFFVVFNAIFSDIFLYTQHLVLFGYTLAVYTFLTGIFALLAPTSWYRWIHVFTWPALVFSVLFSFSEFGPRVVLHLTYAVLAIDGAGLGAWFGLTIRTRKQPNDPAIQIAKARYKKFAPWLIGLTVLGVLGSGLVL